MFTEPAEVWLLSLPKYGYWACWSNAYVGKGAVGFAKSAWNPNFSGAAEALYERGIAKHSFAPN